MNRGSTPTQLFNLGIDLREAAVYVTYSQHGETIIERTNDTIEIRESQIEFKLTQEETLKLEQGRLEIQIKFKLPDGTVDYSEIINTEAKRVLKGEVI